MLIHFNIRKVSITLLLSSVAFAASADAQNITHQITLPDGVGWCDDSMTNGLFSAINAYRSEQGVPALAINALGMKDAEMRAVQLSAYMATVPPTSPNWDPHQGYDTTAASLGYALVSENLAWGTTDYSYIVNAVWQDPLHIAAMLSKAANVAGVSCVYANGWPYWTYEPGIGSSSSPAPTPTPSPNPSPTPPPTTPPALDSEESAFVTLINNYRAQNGVGLLQVSVTLQTASQWMSTDMASDNYISHTDALGRSTQARLAAFGYSYSPWGENLAAGDSDAQTTFNDFVTDCDPDSSGNCTYSHRANILNGSFVALGVARAYSANSMYGWYWATDFGGYLDQALNPTPPSAPVIASFVASPRTIAYGQTATLSWSVSGATSVTIDNGIGNTSSSSWVTVAPTSTTTYQLIAKGTGGTAAAAVTITVNQPSQPVPPPTAPTLISANAISSTEVDLNWTASTDPAGIAGYQIIRNGVYLIQVPAASQSYADKTVTAGTAYTYSIQAVNSAEVLSAMSNALTVTPATAASGPGSSSTCPAPAIAQFTGCYYNNVIWVGAPALVRTASEINFNWTKAPPSPAVSFPSFSVKWQGNFNFGAGYYIFTLNVSGGVVLYIDGGLVENLPQSFGTHTAYDGVILTQGQHLITVEYHNTAATPLVQVSWQQSTN